MSGRRAALAAWLAAAWLCGAGCEKGDASAAQGARPERGDQAYRVGPDRLAQGMQLCMGFEQRVCACAAKGTDAAFVEACEFAHARPDALKMYIKLLAGAEGPLATRERLEAEAGAEKLIAACVTADAKLDPSTCPR